MNTWIADNCQTQAAGPDLNMKGLKKQTEVVLIVAVDTHAHVYSEIIVHFMCKFGLDKYSTQQKNIDIHLIWHFTKNLSRTDFCLDKKKPATL